MAESFSFSFPLLEHSLPHLFLLFRLFFHRIRMHPVALLAVCLSLGIILLRCRGKRVIVSFTRSPAVCWWRNSAAIIRITNISRISTAAFATMPGNFFIHIGFPLFCLHCNKMLPKTQGKQRPRRTENSLLFTNDIFIFNLVSIHSR